MKAAFTRTLNKEFQRVSCAANIKTKGATDYSENQSGEEDIFSEEIDSIESDPMIKVFNTSSIQFNLIQKQIIFYHNLFIYFSVIFTNYSNYSRHYSITYSSNKTLA